MFNLLKKFQSKNQLSESLLLKESFITEFYKDKSHAWMTPQVKKHFDHLWSRTPANMLKHLWMNNGVVFIPQQLWKTYEQNRYYHAYNVVVVYPRFQALLEGNKNWAVAYLAHELGALFFELDAKKDPLLCDIEADKFVCDLGLADELEHLLLDMDESDEKRLRLTYLTLNTFNINQ